MEGVKERVEVRSHSSRLFLLLIYLLPCPQADHDAENDLEHKNANQSDLVTSKLFFRITISQIDRVFKAVSTKDLSLLVVSALNHLFVISCGNSAI